MDIPYTMRYKVGHSMCHHVLWLKSGSRGVQVSFALTHIHIYVGSRPLQEASPVLTHIHIYFGSRPCQEASQSLVLLRISLSTLVQSHIKRHHPPPLWFSRNLSREAPLGISLSLSHSLALSLSLYLSRSRVYTSYICLLKARQTCDCLQTRPGKHDSSYRRYGTCEAALCLRTTPTT